MFEPSALPEKADKQPDRKEESMKPGEESRILLETKRREFALLMNLIGRFPTILNWTILISLWEEISCYITSRLLYLRILYFE